MYEEALMEGKVLKEIDTNYMYYYDDEVVWLLHQADKRIFKATFYKLEDFKLPNKKYEILDITNICID